MKNKFDGLVNSSDIIYNPYPLYDLCRKKKGIFYSEIKNAWIIMRYSDIEKIVSIPDSLEVKRKNFQSSSIDPLVSRKIENFFKDWPLYTDLPKHKNYRKILNKIVTNKGINSAESFINKNLPQLVRDLKKFPYIDYYSNFCLPISKAIISNAFQMNRNTAEQLFNESRILINIMFGRIDPGELDKSIILASIENCTKYIKSYIENISNNEISDKNLPGIFSNLIFDSIEPLCDSIANFLFFYFTLDSNALRNLKLQFDIDKDFLTKDIIALDAPFQYVVRIAKKDISIDESLIKKGEKVMLFTASANFDKPDDREYMSFGVDHHFCVGATLSIRCLKSIIEVFLCNDLGENVRFLEISRHMNLGSRSIYKMMVSREIL